MKQDLTMNNLITIEIKRAKALGIIFAALLFYVFAIILWKQGIIDNNIVIHFNYVYNSDGFLKLFKIISNYGISFITGLYAIFLILTFKFENLKSERQLFILILFSFAFAGIAGELLKLIIGKSRPIVILGQQIAIKKFHATLSFPSGHATKSMALALPFVLFASRKKTFVTVFKLLVLSLAILVCYSRIAQQAHFLSDVLAGIGTALFLLPFCVFFVNFIYKKKKTDLNKLSLISKNLIFIYIVLTVLLFFL